MRTSGWEKRQAPSHKKPIFSCLAAACPVLTLLKSSKVKKKERKKNATALQRGCGVSPPEAALVVSELKCPDAVSLLQSTEVNLKEQSRVCFPCLQGSADTL